MAILVVPNKTLLDEIVCTPDLEGGVGPVLIGTPIELADSRLACCHPWTEVITDWLTAYVVGIAGAEVIAGEVLPYPVKNVVI